jgi:hypothetical protein
MINIKTNWKGCIMISIFLFWLINNIWTIIDVWGTTFKTFDSKGVILTCIINSFLIIIIFLINITYNGKDLI